MRFHAKFSIATKNKIITPESNQTTSNWQNKNKNYTITVTDITNNNQNTTSSNIHRINPNKTKVRAKEEENRLVRRCRGFWSASFKNGSTCATAASAAADSGRSSPSFPGGGGGPAGGDSIVGRNKRGRRRGKGRRGEALPPLSLRWRHCLFRTLTSTTQSREITQMTRCFASKDLNGVEGCSACHVGRVDCNC